MPVSGPGPYQLRVLSARLREAGDEGKGLRRELLKAVTRAARPLAAEVKDAGHLRPYMPDRYADVLAADLSVTTSKSTGRNPGIAIRAKGRRHRRKVIQLDAGILSHPVFGNREVWRTQTSHVRAGFFTDPAERAAPEIRRQVLDAMREVGGKLTGG
jgi:hypothetical protein